MADTFAAVTAAVRDVVVDLYPDRDAIVWPDTHLESDLGLDSLAVVEVAVRVEETTGQRVADEALADLATVGDLIAAVTGPRSATDRPDTAGAHIEPDADAANDPPARPAQATVGTPDEAPARPGAAAPGAAAAGASGVGASGGGLVYGVYAIVVFAAVAVVAWTAIALLPGIDRRWAVVRTAGKVMFALTGTRLRVVGADRLPQGGPYVVVANHVSFVDPLVLAMVLPPPVVFTAVEGLAINPLVRHFLRRMDCYLLVPGDRPRARADVAELTRVVQRGRAVAAFPEARRSVRVGVESFRIGAFRVASDAQAPVVPVALRGTRAILPVDARLPRRSAVEVRIGEPLAATSTGWSGALGLLRAARQEILDGVGEPDLA